MKYIVSLVFLFLSVLCQGQSYVLKESEITEKYYPHRYFRLEGGRFADLRFSEGWKDPATLRIYDGALKQLASYSIAETEDARFESGCLAGQSLLLGFTDKKKDVLAYAVNPKDGRARLITTLVNDNAGDAMVRTGVSPDSMHFFMMVRFRKKKASIYKGLILDRQLGAINTFSTSVDETGGPVEEISYVLANDGTFSIINAVGSPSKEPYIPLVYAITQVSSAGKVSTGTLKGIPEGLFDNVVWQGNGSDLSFTGFLGVTRKSGFSSIVTGVYHAQQPVADLKEYALTEDIPYSAGLLTVHRDANNALTIILVEGAYDSDTWSFLKKTYCAEAIAPSVSSVYSSTKVTYFGNGAAHMVRFRSDGSLYWVRSVQKNQEERSRFIYAGVAPLFTADGGIRLFFQDSRESRQPGGTKHTHVLLPGRKTIGLACVTILADGKLAKKEFLDSYVENDPSGFFFSPDGAISDGASKIIYMWFDMHNVGRSEYRVGSITVE